MWQVYGFTAAPLAAIDDRDIGVGLAGEALIALPFEGVLAIAGERANAMAIDVADIVAYDRIERRLADLFSAYLPARLGPPLGSALEVGAFIAARAEALRAALELVRDRVQMTLRLAAPAGRRRAEGVERASAEETGALGPGARHLVARRRAAEQARAVPELEPIRRRVSALIRRESCERHARGPWAASAHHLIDRGAADEYRARVDAALEATRRDAAASWALSGPSPTYAFHPGALP